MNHLSITLIIFALSAAFIVTGWWMATKTRKRPKGPTKVIEVYEGKEPPF